MLSESGRDKSQCYQSQGGIRVKAIRVREGSDFLKLRIFQSMGVTNMNIFLLILYMMVMKTNRLHRMRRRGSYLPDYQLVRTIYFHRTESVVSFHVRNGWLIKQIRLQLMFYIQSVTIKFNICESKCILWGQVGSQGLATHLAPCQ